MQAKFLILLIGTILTQVSFTSAQDWITDLYKVHEVIKFVLDTVISALEKQIERIFETRKYYVDLITGPIQNSQMFIDLKDCYETSMTPIVPYTTFLADIQSTVIPQIDSLFDFLKNSPGMKEVGGLITRYQRQVKSCNTSVVCKTTSLFSNLYALFPIYKKNTEDLSSILLGIINIIYGLVEGFGNSIGSVVKDLTHGTYASGLCVALYLKTK